MDFAAIGNYLSQQFLCSRFFVNLAAVGGMLALLLAAWAGAWHGLHSIWPNLDSNGRLGWAGTFSDAARKQVRALLGWSAFTAATGFVMVGLAYHLAGRHIDRDFVDVYNRLTTRQLWLLATAAGELVAVVGGVLIGLRLVRRYHPKLEAAACARFAHLQSQPAAKGWFLLGQRYISILVVLLGARLATHAVGLGQTAQPAIFFTLRLITVVILARLLILAGRMLMGPIGELGDRRLQQTFLYHYWERLARLLPLGERCFEAAVYVTAATLCVQQFTFIPMVADWGPAIVKCIGIFFGTRVIAELMQVLLYELFGLNGEASTRDPKRQTLVPLLYSGCQYLLYFGAGVAILDQLGAETQPILAGAGILGLACGLGAQSLITDVVSGLFILFENQYLVGDYVEIGTAKGVVESVAVRHTEIRDEQGKLHLIPNGQIKEVVNYSKGYINAVIDFRLPSGGDLQGLLRAMSVAATSIRARPDVLADPEIQGIVEMTLAEMTIRATIKVRPGARTAVEAKFRELLQISLAESSGRQVARLAA